MRAFVPEERGAATAPRDLSSSRTAPGVDHAATNREAPPCQRVAEGSEPRPRRGFLLVLLRALGAWGC